MTHVTDCEWVGDGRGRTQGLMDLNGYCGRPKHKIGPNIRALARRFEVRGFRIYGSELDFGFRV